MNSLIQVTVQKILISIYNVQYIYNNFTVMDSTVRYQQFKFQVALEESVLFSRSQDNDKATRNNMVKKNTHEYNYSDRL